MCRDGRVLVAGIRLLCRTVLGGDAMTRPLTKGAARVWLLVLNFVLLGLVVGTIDWAWRTVSGG